MNRGMVELIQPDQAGLVYGLAALFTYSDTDEVETLADRAIVLSRGHIAGVDGVARRGCLWSCHPEGPLTVIDKRPAEDQGEPGS